MAQAFQLNAFQFTAFQGGSAAVTEFDYFFLFDNEAQARADPVIGSYFSLPGIYPNIWAFDLAPSPKPVSGWWVMIARGNPDTTLAGSANLKFFLALPADILFQTFRDNSTNEQTVIAYATGKASYAKNWALGPP